MVAMAWLIFERVSRPDSPSAPGTHLPNHQAVEGVKVQYEAVARRPLSGGGLRMAAAAAPAVYGGRVRALRLQAAGHAAAAAAAAAAVASRLQQPARNRVPQRMAQVGQDALAQPRDHAAAARPFARRARLCLCMRNEMLLGC